MCVCVYIYIYMAAKHSEFTPMHACRLCVGVMEKTGLSQ